nr:PREDICTED: proclotting enzyme [Tribolium castaneum]|eukprot:XP_970121.3 PREDICTED: proclotting enzyme [Tribolium castaneum]
MHFRMHLWIIPIGNIFLVCFLFHFSHEYSPREYYVPWLDEETDSPRWVKLPQRRNVESQQSAENTRHFAPDTINRITETLGAINTVGRYLVNMTRGATDTATLSDEVPSAIYTISKNVLGRNVTDSIAPLVREALPVVIDNKNDEEEEDEDPKSCTTPEGLKGYCDDLSDCPQLLLNLGNLRQSLCFKSLFVPGVCCPRTGNVESVTLKPVQVTTIRTQKLKPVPVVTPPPTTKPPPVEIPNLGLNPLGNIVDPSDCGQPESAKYRVVGGEEALPGRWPWMAAIFLHGSRRTEFWCGGSLITAKHVLTAAHCTRDSRQRPFAAKQFTVRLGDIDLKRNDEPSSPITFKVSEIRAHPQFSRVGFYNDIAVLVLDKPARKSKYVIPLCLPPPELRNEKFAGRKTTVVGWGTTFYGGKESTVQRQAVLPIWRNEDCNQAYFQPITDNFICAGYSEGGTDACQGDSGGPLMIHWDTRWIQVGVVSFGNKCGEPGYPGVYTRITNYLEWIKENTKT